MRNTGNTRNVDNGYGATLSSNHYSSPFHPRKLYVINGILPSRFDT